MEGANDFICLLNNEYSNFYCLLKTKILAKSFNSFCTCETSWCRLVGEIPIMGSFNWSTYLLRSTDNVSNQGDTNCSGNTSAVQNANCCDTNIISFQDHMIFNTSVGTRSEKFSNDNWILTIPFGWGLTKHHIFIVKQSHWSLKQKVPIQIACFWHVWMEKKKKNSTLVKHVRLKD